jgi:hypothetical protein
MLATMSNNTPKEKLYKIAIENRIRVGTVMGVNVVFRSIQIITIKIILARVEIPLIA